MRCLALISSVILFLAISSPAPCAEQMILVPAGTFIMGDGTSTCGVMEHEVTLTRDFFLCQHEVTNQEYLEAVQWAYDHGYVIATTTVVRDNLDGSAFLLLSMGNDWSEIQFDAGTFYLRESPCSDAQNAYPDGYDPSDHPVKMATWFGMVRYCDWLSLQDSLPRAYEHGGDWSCNGGDPYGAEGYRLPTDAEWEYAAQFDDERIYPWGDEPPDCTRANFNPGQNGLCVGWSTPVGSYPDGNSYLGLWDMAGNMWEWCNDWWVCHLGTDPVTDPTGPSSGTLRVYHGGDWFWTTEEYLRCADRFNDPSGPPNNSGSNVGFRVARTSYLDPAGIDTEPERGRSQLLFDVIQPNPFTTATQITYSVPGSAPTLLTVYDVGGRRIRTLVNEIQHAGLHSVTWDGTDEAGSPVATGVYFCRLSTGKLAATRQVRLTR